MDDAVRQLAATLSSMDAYVEPIDLKSILEPSSSIASLIASRNEQLLAARIQLHRFHASNSFDKARPPDHDDEDSEIARLQEECRDLSHKRFIADKMLRRYRLKMWWN